MNLLNDEAFSDRILRIEIVAGPSDSKPDSVESEVDSAMDSEGNPPSKKRKLENLEEKGDAVTGVEVRTLHISSAILATQSAFFYKLFKESQESVASLRIDASEEVALTDVLNFMYSGTLSAKTTRELLDVLVISDKFEVTSCISYCCNGLKSRNMCSETHETAPLYLELPSSVLECAAFKSVLCTVKSRVVQLYKDVTKSYKSRPEAMSLPLSALEVVLGSNDLQVRSEDEVYDFVLLWGRARYPNQAERRKILTNLLGRFLHFPSLTMSKLEQIRECPEFDTNEVSKLIMNSLYLNSADYGQRHHFPADVGCHSIHRDYRDLPIKEVPLESGCVVFWNLTKENRLGILRFSKNGSKVYSHPFLLGGVSFALYVVTETAGVNDGCLGLFVERRHAGEETFLFDYELAVMNSSKEFESRLKAENCSLTRNWCAGLMKLFQFRSFTHFPDIEEREYVIDGVVRIRVVFTILDSMA